MKKISVVIITKNEERFIEECLQSVTWADEIIVVDSYSNDKTVEIAKKYSHRVVQREWQGFASQKNYGISLANCEWVLSLDADERVSSELQNEIINTLREENTKEGYYLPRKNFFRNKWLKGAGNYPDYQLRLFKKTYQFQCRDVHERVEINGNIGYLREGILHYTYDSITDLVSKINKYTSLEAQIELKNGCPPRIWEFFYLPIRKFFWAYIYKQGYKDGRLGLIISICLTVYVFLSVAKSWEAFAFADNKSEAT